MEKDVLFNALRIAIEAHDGQVDRAGKPYIYHPLAVAAMVNSFDEFVAALLHDVMEDADYNADDLIAAGIPEHIVDALRLLSHDKNVPYMDYIAQIKGNDLAKAVKLADLKHNSDLGRLPVITDKDLKRAEKYRRAILLLQA